MIYNINNESLKSNSFFSNIEMVPSISVTCKAITKPALISIILSQAKATKSNGLHAFVRSQNLSPITLYSERLRVVTLDSVLPPSIEFISLLVFLSLAVSSSLLLVFLSLAVSSSLLLVFHSLTVSSSLLL